MSEENTNVAQKIDDSHKEPSEVKTVLVNGAPVLDVDVTNRAVELGKKFGLNESASSITQGEILNGLAILFVQNIGLTPTKDQAMAFRDATETGIRQGYAKGGLTNPADSTIENAKSKVMNFIYDQGVEKPASKEKSAVSKANAKSVALDSFETEFESNPDAVKSALKDATAQKTEYEPESVEYKEVEREEKRIAKVLKEGTTKIASDNKKAVRGFNEGSNDYHKKILSHLNKTGNKELAEDYQNYLEEFWVAHKPENNT
jgi:hypothetical protein